MVDRPALNPARRLSGGDASRESPPGKPPTLVPGALDMMILKILEIGPEHGYGIARRIKRTSDEVLIVEEGSLYPALHRLAKRGYVESEVRPSETNRRAKYYRLTTAGRTQLAQEAAAWERLVSAIGRVMATPPSGEPATSRGVASGRTGGLAPGLA